MHGCLRCEVGRYQLDHLAGADEQHSLTFTISENAVGELQRILNEGLFVASYKFALVLALAELAVEKAPAADGTLAIPLTELSDRFITLYWHHTAPFAGGVVLAQNNGRQAAAMVAYLAGPEAGFVTGASLTIDGGFTA